VPLDSVSKLGFSLVCVNVLRIQKGENERQLGKTLLDELIKDYKNPEDLIGETGLLKQLTKALMERWNER
jgi:hypothetical protein